MAKGLIERLWDDGRRARKTQEVLDARFGPGASEIEEVLKSGYDAIIFAGQFRGQRAVFKQFLRGDCAGTVQRMEEELGFLHNHLGDGTCRVNRILAALPRDGLAILEYIPADRVSLVLKADDPQKRADVLALCGAWLATVAPLRTEMRRLGRTRLERQFDDLNLHALSAQDKDLVQGLTQAARALGKQIKGTHVSHAIAHGDFAPVNMMSDGRTIWAVDIQGATRFPLARIVARFLVAKDIYAARPAARRWGLDADDLRCFAPERILPDPELAAVLPFFVAQQFVRRFVSSYPQRGGHPVARARLETCLNDLEAA